MQDYNIDDIAKMLTDDPDIFNEAAQLNSCSQCGATIEPDDKKCKGCGVKQRPGVFFDKEFLSKYINSPTGDWGARDRKPKR